MFLEIVNAVLPSRTQLLVVTLALLAAVGVGTLAHTHPRAVLPYASTLSVAAIAVLVLDHAGLL